MLVRSALCNGTAAPKHAEVLCLVSLMDSLQKLVGKLQESRGLLVCGIPGCFLVRVPVWSIGGPSHCLLQALLQMLPLKFGWGSSSEAHHIAVEK